MELTHLRARWRLWLYPLVVFWIVWLFYLSNIFTMGYINPLPKKIALTIFAVLLPVILIMRQTKDSLTVAIILILLTWWPLAAMWKFS